MFYTRLIEILQNLRYTTNEVSFVDGFERRKQKKAAQIFNAAADLFFKFGYQKISVNDIAYQARVSAATIYNYFGTKEQLYTDTLFYWMDQQLHQYEQILNSELTFPEKTKEIMLLEAKNLRKLSDELPQLSSHELSGMMQKMESYTEQKIAHFFRKFVALGKQEGYINQAQAEAVTMRYFMMFQRELSSYWREANQEPAANQQIDQMLELFFYGLAGAKERS